MARNLLNRYRTSFCKQTRILSGEQNISIDGTSTAYALDATVFEIRSVLWVHGTATVELDRLGGSDYPGNNVTNLNDPLWRRKPAAAQIEIGYLATDKLNPITDNTDTVKVLHWATPTPFTTTLTETETIPEPYDEAAIFRVQEWMARKEKDFEYAKYLFTRWQDLYREALREVSQAGYSGVGVQMHFV